MTSITLLREDLKKLTDQEKGAFLQRFFKTGKGEYAEGDVFLGISVPAQRKISVKYKDLPLKDVEELLKSKFHEERLIALFLLVHNFKKGDEKERKEIYEFYLKNTRYVNNWDLVDSSADKIVGEYLLDQYLHSSSRSEPPCHTGTNRRVSSMSLRRAQARNISVLLELARSKNIWEKRIAMIATYAFIKTKRHEEALQIAEILVNDTHDLIQKAVGWMLREVGKRVSKDAEEKFLKKHYKTMPRTALRYAIEHFPEEKRKAYLAGNI